MQMHYSRGLQARRWVHSGLNFFFFTDGARVGIGLI